MVKYDAELCERLEREAREDDAKMSRAPWEIDCEGDSVIAPSHLGRMVVDLVGAPNCGGDGPAIARTRNNLRAIADQLAAARAELTLKQGVIDSGNEAFRVAREEWQRELAAARVEIERLRQANASLIPGGMITATEIECLRVERDAARRDVEAKQRGYDDLHAMLPGTGDIWSKVDGLLRRMAADRNQSMSIESRAILERDRAVAERDAMRPVVEAAERWRYKKYPQMRSWHAEVGDDELVSVVDAYRAARDDRRPLPPEVLADARHDTVHSDAGPSRPVRADRDKEVRCGECDPSFGCFAEPSSCRKRPLP